MSQKQTQNDETQSSLISNHMSGSDRADEKADQVTMSKPITPNTDATMKDPLVSEKEGDKHLKTTNDDKDTKQTKEEAMTTGPKNNAETKEIGKPEDNKPEMRDEKKDFDTFETPGETTGNKDTAKMDEVSEADKIKMESAYLFQTKAITSKCLGHKSGDVTNNCQCHPKSSLENHEEDPATTVAGEPAGEEKPVSKETPFSATR